MPCSEPVGVDGPKKSPGLPEGVLAPREGAGEFVKGIEDTGIRRGLFKALEGGDMYI